ncbi:MAG TPA: hypothetical protein VFQ40_07585, partial [Actinomycetota bacterium]|nr:hypothetical protein [Actinomycetota bacterium]
PNTRGTGTMQKFLGRNPRSVRRIGNAARRRRRVIGKLPYPGRPQGRPVRPGGIRPGPPGLGGNQPPGQGGVVPGLGLPLDAFYEGDRRVAEDMRSGALAQAQALYDTGIAGLAETELLGNREIDSDMAARGLFGSGVEKRSERLLGNDIARSKLGLLGDLTGAKSAAEGDYARAMQDALLALGQRNQENRFLPYGQTQGKGKKRAGAPGQQKKRAGGRRRGAGGRRRGGGRAIPRGGRRRY